MVENHLETLIIKHFDPKKADSIFSAEGEVRVLTLSMGNQIECIDDFYKLQIKLRVWISFFFC